MRSIKFFLLFSLIFSLFFFSPLKQQFKNQVQNYFFPQKQQLIPPIISSRELFELPPHLLEAKNIEKVDLIYHPLAVLDIKYSDSDYSTHQGKLLWDLIDGEMIISSRTWKKTSGLQEYLEIPLSAEQLSIAKKLASSPQGITLQDLCTATNSTEEIINEPLEFLLEKQLVKSSKNLFFLHQASPRFPELPITILERDLFFTEKREEDILSPKIPLDKVKNFSKKLFERDFSILNASTYYLPVYRIHVENLSGEKKIIEWNGWTNRAFSL